MRKKAILYGIIALVVVIGLSVAIFFATDDLRYYRGEAKERLKMCNEVGKDFGVTDFTYVGYDESIFQPAYSYMTIYLESETFGQLSQEQMHAFFRALYEKDGVNSGSYKKSTCSDCNGTGKKLVKWYSEGDWGEVSYSSYTCTKCNGTGRS